MEEVEPTAEPKMRFRVLQLPRDQFVIIMDNCPDDLIEGEADAQLIKALSGDLVDRLEGCGGVIATNKNVDMEAWYPYG